LATGQACRLPDLHDLVEDFPIHHVIVLTKVALFFSFTYMAGERFLLHSLPFFKFKYVPHGGDAPSTLSYLNFAFPLLSNIVIVTNADAIAK
jgi:hypothetical protein